MTNIIRKERGKLLYEKGGPELGNSYYQLVQEMRTLSVSLITECVKYMLLTTSNSEPTSIWQEEQIPILPLRPCHGHGHVGERGVCIRRK